jgi:hypothetical protein
MVADRTGVGGGNHICLMVSNTAPLPLLSEERGENWIVSPGPPSTPHTNETPAAALVLPTPASLIYNMRSACGIFLVLPRI